MKILYLCDMKYWQRKLPRTRFHSVIAMREYSEVHCTGNGFPDWNDGNSIASNLAGISFTPDWIFVYKPEQYSGWDEVEIPTVTSFNDAWETSSRIRDIKLPRCRVVIMHHENEVEEWRERFPNVRFESIPYPINPDVFKDYGQNKDIDILLTGAVDKVIYPLRARFAGMIQRGAFHPYRAEWRRHPGYRLQSPEMEAKDYAMTLNRAKVCLADTSMYGYAAEKYHEIPACRSVLCGNMPDERRDAFMKFLRPIDPAWTDAAIVESVKRLLAQPDLLSEMSLRGYNYVHRNHTAQLYAKRFVAILEGTE